MPSPVLRTRRPLMATLLFVLLLTACAEPENPAPGPGSSSGGGPASATVAPTPAPTTSDATLAAWPSAKAVQDENARPGDARWTAGVSEPPSTRVEGFTGRASVTPGQPLAIFIRSLDGPVVVRAYRIGWYAGAGARLVWTSPDVTQVDQPKPTFEPATRTWSASNWAPSATLPTDDWPPGDYVLKLQAKTGTVNLVPLTVRPTTTRNAVVIVNENTTWHAYNRWGGTSLYRGPTGFADRAYAVSLDRPIDYGMGTGDYWGNEAPLGRLAEKLGLPVAYVTDTDLHADPHLLDGARAVISLGHDEYYSQAMWDALVAARDRQGTNLAFLGANAMYRHIRLGPTPIGPDRLETDYKDAGIDPILKTNPAEATSQWRQPPVPRPESVVTGVYYQCNPVKADMVVAQPDSWLLAGSGLKPGDKLASLVGSEYDQVTPSVPTPRPDRGALPLAGHLSGAPPVLRCGVLHHAPAAPESSPPAPAPGSAAWSTSAPSTPRTSTWSTSSPPSPPPCFRRSPPAPPGRPTLPATTSARSTSRPPRSAT